IASPAAYARARSRAAQAGGVVCGKTDKDAPMRTSPRLNRSESPRKYFAIAAAAIWFLLNFNTPVRGALEDVVLYSSDLSMVGTFWKASDPAAAVGEFIASPDSGWSRPHAAQASPSTYADGTFSAEANVSYRVWVRLRAGLNSKW